MKKLLSLMLALCMALLAVPALAETAEEEAVAVAYTGTLAFTVEENALPLLTSLTGSTDESTQTMLSNVISLVNNLKLQAATDGNAVEIKALLKDAPVTTIGIQPDGDNLAIFSDLFPNSVITLSADALQQQMGNASSILENLDVEAIATAVTTELTTVVTEISQKIGEAEAVSYIFDDVEFTSKQPINMTTKELVLLVLNAVKNIASNETISGLVSQLGGNMDLSSLDSTIEDMTNKDESELPTLDAGIYSNESGDTLFALAMTQDEQTLSVEAGQLGTNIRVKADILQQMTLDMTIDMMAGSVVEDITMNNNGTLIAMHEEFQGTDNGVTGTITVSQNGAEMFAMDVAVSAGDAGFDASFALSMSGMKLLTISLNAAPGAEITSSFSTEGKTVVAADSLLAGGDANEVLAPVIEDIQSSGLMAVLTNAMTAMPAEIGALMSSQSAQ